MSKQLQVYKDKLAIFISGINSSLNSYIHVGKGVLLVNIYINRRYQHGHKLRLKIKFYLFAIAYLPTLFPPTRLFFAFPEHIFFFFLLSECFTFSANAETW